MNQAVLDQLTSVVADYFAEQPLEGFDPPPAQEPAGANGHELTALLVHRNVRVVAIDPMDDLFLASWEDAEWR